MNAITAKKQFSKLSKKMGLKGAKPGDLMEARSSKYYKAPKKAKKVVKIEKTEKGHGKKHEIKEPKSKEKAEHKVIKISNKVMPIANKSKKIVAKKGLI